MPDDLPGPDDLIEQGRDRPARLPGRLARWLPARVPSPGRGVIALVALVVGLAAGYMAGDWHGRSVAATPAVTVSASPRGEPAVPVTTSPALTQDIAVCSTQHGKDLEVGVQVTNQSAAPIELTTVKAVLPLNGLRQLSWHWGPCGKLPSVGAPGHLTLAASDSTWVSITFRVEIGCPGPLPVQFGIGYELRGRSRTTTLPGFNDLGQVPYSGCSRSQSG